MVERRRPSFYDDQSLGCLCSFIHVWRRSTAVDDADEKYDGTLLASLIILPQWSAYFGNPTGNTMGLIVFFIYAWFGFKETKGFTMEEVGYVFDGPDVVEEIRRNAGLRMASGGDKIAETEHDEDPSRGQDIVNRTAT
jgi:hypothetical protein